MSLWEFNNDNEIESENIKDFYQLNQNNNSCQNNNLTIDDFSFPKNEMNAFMDINEKYKTEKRIFFPDLENNQDNEMSITNKFFPLPFEKYEKCFLYSNQEDPNPKNEEKNISDFPSLFQNDIKNLSLLNFYNYFTTSRVSGSEDEEKGENTTKVKDYFETVENQKNVSVLNDIKTKDNKAKNLFKTVNGLLGRKKKNSQQSGKHNKFSYDNIKREIKGKFICSVLEYINTKIKNKKYKNGKLVSGLRKIKNTQRLEISEEKMEVWLEKKMKDVFEVEVIRGNNVNYNKEKIEEIYKDDEENEAKALLEKKVKEFANIFLREDDEQDFEQLKDVLEQLKKKGKKEEDISRYKTVSENFFHLIYKIKKHKKV